jgi:hypothetical protein
MLIGVKVKNKTDAEMDAEMDAYNPETDYPEPHPDTLFYEYFHMLWEMRCGFVADPLKSFDENLSGMIKFNYRKQNIEAILEIKNTYFDNTGEII